MQNVRIFFPTSKYYIIIVLCARTRISTSEYAQRPLYVFFILIHFPKGFLTFFSSIPIFFPFSLLADILCCVVWSKLQKLARFYLCTSWAFAVFKSESPGTVSFCHPNFSQFFQFFSIFLKFFSIFPEFFSPKSNNFSSIPKIRQWHEFPKIFIHFVPHFQRFSSNYYSFVFLWFYKIKCDEKNRSKLLRFCEKNFSRSAGKKNSVKCRKFL